MPRQPEPIRITTATRSHRDDIAGRQKRYLISMTIRTVCFVLTVVSIGHWFMWLFLVASVTAIAPPPPSSCALLGAGVKASLRGASAS